jgi:hypothetical protein
MHSFYIALISILARLFGSSAFACCVVVMRTCSG